MLLIVHQKGVSLNSPMITAIKLCVADVQHRQGLMQGFAIGCALWEDVRQVGLEPKMVCTRKRGGISVLCGAAVIFLPPSSASHLSLSLLVHGSKSPASHPKTLPSGPPEQSLRRRLSHQLTASAQLSKPQPISAAWLSSSNSGAWWRGGGPVERRAFGRGSVDSGERWSKGRWRGSM